KIIWASIDLQLANHRKISTFLITLKKNLQIESHIHFPAFEIAHAIYWKKANPEISLRTENYLLFEGDDTLDTIFGFIDQIPHLNLFPKVARLFKGLPDYFRKYWTNKE